MIYLTLPYFYENYKFNKYFYGLTVDHQERFKTKIKIESVQGSFPWSLWSGDINSNLGNQILYKNLIDTISEINFLTPIILDCSNFLLDKEDYFDIYQNLILKISNDTSIYLEIADLDLYNYIKERYPFYNYILSNKINYILPMDNKIINSFLNKTDFIKIILPNDYSNIKELPNKQKLMITIGECDSCNNYQNCLIQEQKNQINSSRNSTFNTCEKFSFINYLDKIEQYKMQGINHFKISPIKGKNNLLEFNFNLLKNFIKEECLNDCIEECIKEGLI